MIKFVFQVFVTYLILNQISCDECDSFPKEGHTLNGHSCCPIPELYNHSWVDDCKTELAFPEKRSSKHLEHESKLYECIVKKAGGVVDGKPNTAAIKKQMKVILDQNPEWANTFNAAVDKCVPDAIAKEDETRKRTSEPPYNIDKNVNTMYGHLVTCVMAHLFSECPVPGDNKSPNCEAFKNFVRKCFNVFPPRVMKPPAN